jgi:hypothetical protein
MHHYYYYYLTVVCAVVCVMHTRAPSMPTSARNVLIFLSVVATALSADPALALALAALAAVNINAAGI